jgi:hypothetical protein
VQSRSRSSTAPSWRMAEASGGATGFVFGEDVASALCEGVLLGQY